MNTNKPRAKKRYVAVVAIIFDSNGKVLLTRRNEPKSTHAHGKWQFPGGGIKFGEHPKEALFREIKEEIGITIQLLSEEPLVHSQVFEHENIHVVLLGYPARYLNGTIDITHDKATDAASWYHYEDIDFPLCLPQVKEMMNKAKRFYPS